MQYPGLHFVTGWIGTFHQNRNIPMTTLSGVDGPRKPPYPVSIKILKKYLYIHIIYIYIVYLLNYRLIYLLQNTYNTSPIISPVYPNVSPHLSSYIPIHFPIKWNILMYIYIHACIYIYTHKIFMTCRYV